MEHITINSDRSVTVPVGLRKIGVQYDHNVNTIDFVGPRYSGNVDLSTMTIYINYILSDKTPGKYKAENVIIDDQDNSLIRFKWTITRNVTKVYGILSCLICAKKTDEEGNEINHWNTDIFRLLSVSEGMENDLVIQEQYPDVITSLIQNIEEHDTKLLEFSGLNIRVTDLENNIDELKDDLNELDSRLSESIAEITESSSKPTVIELHPNKNSGYYWNGISSPSSSYFYYHIDVKEGDVVTIPLSISAGAEQPYRFIDAYKGTTRNADACVNASTIMTTYVVPDYVDNIYISINFRQDYYDYYYVSILRTVEELKPKGISDLTDRVSVLENVIVETKNGYILKKEISNLASGSMITLSEHIDNKKNKSYRFSAKFDTFSSVTVGHGYNVYGGSWVTVDNTNVTAYYYNGSQAVQMGQYAHHLTISDFIDVVVTVGNVANLRAVVTVMSVGGDFTQNNVPMGGCNGSVFAFGGQNLIDVVYSYNLADMLSDVWLFGDSYTSLGDPSRWTHQLMNYGYSDILMCGFSGATSSNEILAFREIMQVGKPKIVVWALGMNDADNGQVNQTWLACVNEVISYCTQNGIELVLATIPCTPRVDNSYKNAYIRESTYRYIDFAKAVNAESVGATWYSGMLSSDNVHPVELGAKALANRFITDMPEVIKKN